VERRYKSGDKTLHVLRGVDLDLFPGEMAGLIGPSGSGKSSLLHVAGLLEKPDAGTVMFNGQNALSMSDSARTMARRLELGFVYQFPPPAAGAERGRQRGCAADDQRHFADAGAQARAGIASHDGPQGARPSPPRPAFGW
jgi:ABC-type glutathione transport system ATPase component